MKPEMETHSSSDLYITSFLCSEKMEESYFALEVFDEVGNCFRCLVSHLSISRTVGISIKSVELMNSFHYEQSFILYFKDNYPHYRPHNYYVCVIPLTLIKHPLEKLMSIVITFRLMHWIILISCSTTLGCT